MILNGKDSIKLRIASQIQLAAWHFNINYSTFYNECIRIIESIFSFNSYKKDLTLLIENVWKIINEERQDLSLNEEILNIIDKKDFIHGLLCVSNSIELLKFESGYETINYSYAIGQLVLANWIFQNIDKKIANDIRNFYHDIENDKIDLKKAELFRNNLWNIFILKR